MYIVTPNTCTHSHTHGHIHRTSWRHTDTRTYRHTDTHTDTHTQTHIHAHTTSMEAPLNEILASQKLTEFRSFESFVHFCFHRFFQNLNGLILLFHNFGNFAINPFFFVIEPRFWLRLNDRFSSFLFL
jgi:hypothetical protein